MLDGLSRCLDPLTSRRPWGTVLAFVVLTVLATLAWPSFRLEPDMSRMLPEENEVVRHMRLLESSAHASRLLLVDLRGSHLEERLPEIERRLRANPRLVDVAATRADILGRSWPAMRQSPSWFLPEEALDEVGERLTTGAGAALRDRKKRVAQRSVTGLLEFTADPLGLQSLLEASVERSLPFQLEPDSKYVVFRGGDRAVFRVEGREESFDLDFCRAVQNDLETVLREVVPDGSWFFYGDYAKAAHQSDEVRQDLTRCSVVSLVLVSVFLVWSWRRLVDPLLVFLPVAAALYFSLPLAGWVFGPMSMLTVSAAAILIGLGVDFSIHFLVRYTTERESADHDTAARRSLRVVAAPLLASLLTTVIAFLSMTPAEFAGLRVFGFLMAGGLVLCFVGAVAGLPLLLRWRAPGARFQPTNRVVAWFDQAAHGRFARPLATFCFVAMAAGFAAAALHGIEFRSDLDFVRSKDDVFFDARTRFEEEIGFSIPPVILMVPKDVPGKAVSEAVQVLTDRDLVRLSDGYHLAYPTERRRQKVESFLASIAGWREHVVDELQALNLGKDLFLPGLEVFDQLLRAEPALDSDFVIELDGVPFHRVLCFPARGILRQAEWESFDRELRAAFGDVPFRAFHPQVLMNEVSRVLFADLIRASVATAVLAVGVVLWLSGGLRPGLVALVPCAVGFGGTLGLLALTGTPLNMGNCVAIPLLLGIGVDHGVHLAAHFRRTGDTRLGDCGVAIWRSSATSMVGFGALMAARVPGIASLGAISVLGVLLCMASALFLGPILWARWVGTGPGTVAVEASSLRTEPVSAE